MFLIDGSHFQNATDHRVVAEDLFREGGIYESNPGFPGGISGIEATPVQYRDAESFEVARTYEAKLTNDAFILGQRDSGGGKGLHPAPFRKGTLAESCGCHTGQMGQSLLNASVEVCQSRILLVPGGVGIYLEDENILPIKSGAGDEEVSKTADQKAAGNKECKRQSHLGRHQDAAENNTARGSS